MYKRAKKAIIILLAVSLLAGVGCSIRGTKKNSFEELLKRDNAYLLREARAREDKVFYGKATSDVVFPVYFPLVLPDDVKPKEHIIRSSNFDGEVGQLIVFYTRGNDELVIYQGKAPNEESEVVTKKNIVLGKNKPNASYYKKDNGYTYISWQEENPDGNPLYNNEIEYVVKAKGLSDDELVGIVNKMVIYDDKKTGTDNNSNKGPWQT